ncbi:MAG: MFS transporter [Pseudonocardia sp.]
MVSAKPDQAAEVPRPEHAEDHRRWLVLGVVLTGTFLVIGGVSIVNLAVPSMRRSFDADASEIGIVIASYALVYATLLIAGGRLGDMFGRKNVMMVGLGLFAGAVLVGGLAPTVGVLIAARVLQGVGAALIYPQILSTIEDTFEGRERGVALGAFGATVGGALVFGQLLGGALIELDIAGLGWRPAMLVLAPLGLVALVACGLFMSSSPPSSAGTLDYRGTTVLAVALTMLVYPLLSGRDAGWPAWMVVTLVLSGPALALFMWLERRTVARAGVPLLDPALFAQRAFAVGTVMGVVFFIGALGIALYTSVTLQSGLGFGPLESGLAFTPLGVAFFLTSLLAPRLVERMGRGVLALGYALITAGMLGLALTVQVAEASIGVWTLAPALVLVGAGQGFGMSPLIGSVLAGIRHEDAGSAAGALTTAFQLGQSLGIAVVGMVFFGSLGAEPTDVGHYLAAYTTVALALAGLAVLLFCLVFALPGRAGIGTRHDVFLHDVPSRLAGLVHSTSLATGGHCGDRTLRKILLHHLASPRH